MKKTLGLILLCLPLLILATTLSTTIQFPVPAEGLSLQALSKEGYGCYGAPGTLQLPVKQVNILLPKDAVIDSWQVKFDSAKTLAGEPPAINSAFTNGEEILTSPVNRNTPSRYSYSGLRKWGELNYACFNILPAVYEGANWQWNSSCNITLNYTATAKAKGVIPPVFNKADFFANPQYLSRWYNTSKERNNRLLVITTPNLYAALNTLVLYREAQGVEVSFCDIAIALASGTGTDNAEKLRNFLQNTYVQIPFSYLLLVGDYDLVPVAYVIPEPNGLDTVATDFFYSDLSSNWDTDNDGRRGEYSTGYMNEDYGIDFTPEVFAGRISTNNATEVSAIANRIVAYEQTTEPWKDKNLLPAAFLNYQGEPEPPYLQTDGALFMEFMRNTCLAEQENFSMYEQEGVVPSFPGDLPLNYNNLRNKLNSESWGFINWDAHGSSGHSSRRVWENDYNQNNLPEDSEMDWKSLVDCQSFDNLENTSGTVIYAASCYNGYLDYSNACLAEYALIKKAVGVIAATRTGWYKIGWQNPGWGGLASYDYHFVENFRQAKLDLGSAHSWANLLHTQFYLFGDPVDNGGIIYPELQNVYTYMLFGDPMLGWIPNQINPTGEILVWEPTGNEGLAVVNALRQISDFNVIYSDKLIPDYAYLNNFEAVFYLAGKSLSETELLPTAYEYSYLNSYLEAGGKLYCENYFDDSYGQLYTKMGVQMADNIPLSVTSILYPANNITWNYVPSDSSVVYALMPNQISAEGIFFSSTGNTDNPIIGVLNATDNYSVLTSTFRISQIESGDYTLRNMLGIILSELEVMDYNPEGNDDPVMPSVIQSLSVFPNPTSQLSSISFNLSKGSPISLAIYNGKGQKVKTIVQSELKSGDYQFTWDGRDKNGRSCASGVYYYKIITSEKSITRKMLLLK
jgi:hypothetical protein